MLELILSGDRATIQNGLVIVFCGAALIWGGAPERAVAATWLIVFELARWVYGETTGNSSQLLEVDIFGATSDVVAGIGFIGIALYANRNYPLWIAAMQVLAIMAHLVRGLSDMISPIAYLTMVIAPGWLQLAFLAIGLGRHIQRKRRYGAYRDWRIVRNPVGSAAGHRLLGEGSVSLPRSEASWRDKLK